MRLRLVVKTERQKTYCLRFVVPESEQRYDIVTNGKDRSVELSFKKEGVFGNSTVESAVADNAAWFSELAIGDDWELKRTETTEPSA